MKILTIFTPTYNRAYTLPRLYQSLLKQDTSIFEWLIVDDGSTDNTHQLVDSWLMEGKLDIRYVYQQNSGKMQAHNRGVEECRTKMFLCCDSDDWLEDYSVKSAVDFWLDHTTGDKAKNLPPLCGMISPRKMVNSEDSFAKMPKSLRFTTLDGLYMLGYKGETALMFITDVIKQHLFPKIEGEKFITEKYVYNQLDRKYQLLVYPEYYNICEYQTDGYTCNALKTALKNPLGCALYLKQDINFSVKAANWQIYSYMAYRMLGHKNPFDLNGYRLKTLILFPRSIVKLIQFLIQLKRINMK